MNKSIAIIGLGLIGGSIAKALKQKNAEIKLSAFDKDEVTKSAIYSGTIDIKLKSIDESLGSDIIFICLPIDAAIDCFIKLAPKLKSGQIIADVCSVKNVFKEIWDNLNSEGIYIGGHPMTGKEKGGFENSDPLLFENAIYILTHNISDDVRLKDFKEVILALGVNILHVPAKQHDVIAASVSHLPQLVSLALVNTSSLKTDSYNFLDLAAGGFRDMTRIASSDYSIWDSIIKENHSEIVTAIEKFVYEMEKLKTFVESNDYKSLNEYFELAHQNREEIPANTKGFLKPLYDVFVFVKDEPGVISKISTALFNEGINIKDIELLKIREGAGGTFRVAFETEDDSKRAKQSLIQVGYKVS